MSNNRPILPYRRQDFPDVNATDDELRRYFIDEFQRIENSLDTSNNAILTTTSAGTLSQQEISALQVTVANNTSTLTTEQNARVNGDSALASDITNLTSTVNGVSASVTTEATTRANADTALQNSINSVIADAATAQSTADGKIVTFYQDDEPTAASLGDLWFDTNDGNKIYRYSGTAWVEAKDTEIATAITNAATAQSTADTAQSSANTAASDAATAQSTADTAQATADGKVVTFYQDNAPTAEGTGDLWVDTNDDNKLYRWSGSDWVSVQDARIPSLEAKYGVNLNVDGFVTGFSQNNDGFSGSFKILADKFEVVDPNGGANGTQQTVFSIDNGLIRINNARVGTSILDANAVTTLTSAYSTNSTFDTSTNILYNENNWETALTTTHTGTGAPVIINWSTRASLQNGTGTASGNYTYSRFYVRILKTIGTQETIAVTYGMLTSGTSANLVYIPVAGTYVDNAGSTGNNSVTYKLQFNRAGFRVGTYLNSMAVLEARR